MALLLCQMLVASMMFNGIFSLPAGSQAVLNTLGAEKLPEFGVGFDLTASYGTAAISFANGTVLSVAKVIAEDGYNEALRRLSLESSQHLVPPYQNPGDAWKDKPREALRSARKIMGLPASTDVGYLAKVISDLKVQVEGYLGVPIKSAGVTGPHLVALYQEDLQDAFDYVGLRYLAFPVRYDVLYETSATYAGYGYGLCSDYTERAACKQEQQDMASEVVMAVLYTRTVLTVSFSVIKSAYYLYEPDNRYLTNFTLGYDARSQWGSEEGYWVEVAKNLEELMAENPNYKRPAKVFLMGDQVHDKAFLQKLEAVLQRQTTDELEIISQDSQFAAAKGAAELAKRLPYDPYMSQEWNSFEQLDVKS
ncbi:MAG: hypothetical protein Q9195_003497 [Heterodermia aff. obscurata]